MRETGADADTRAMVLTRDGNACVICGVRGESIQHRKARKMGGTRRVEINAPSNLITVCGDGVAGCHGMIEAHPELARTNGWTVPDCADPLEVLVRTRFGWVQLDDDGLASPAPAMVAAGG